MSVEKIGAVLVCGAGIAGMQAALDLAGSGFKAYLLDPSPSIGGLTTRSDRIAVDDCSVCMLAPKLVECARNPNIEIFTLADLQSVTGEAGHFKATIRQNPRYVDLKKCEACGDCNQACPVELPEDPPLGAGKRKAISLAFPQAVPNVFAISKSEGLAPCQAVCPAGVNAPGFIALISAGKIKEAWELLRKSTPFPAVCGRVCAHPCQDRCNRAELDQSVSVRGLERYAADWILANPDQMSEVPKPEAMVDGSIAIIGGGPAGLTAAADLASMGCKVTIFEAREYLGGMMMYGIPGYRLPKEIVNKEIDQILRLGITVKTNCPVSKPKDLLKSAPRSSVGADSEKYDAVFVATGAWADKKLNIPGESLPGVMGAISFLSEVNSGHAPIVGPEVLVIGGTELALDAARTALRLPGVAKVRVACLENLAEMPVSPALINEAVEEGIQLHPRIGPTGIERAAGGSFRVSFRACTSLFDDYKRIDPLYDDSEISTISADTILLAAGRTVDSARLGLEARPGGRIFADKDDLTTSIKGIFAGGDAALGASSIINAIAQGHKAAESISAYIRDASLRSAASLKNPQSTLKKPALLAPLPGHSRFASQQERAAMARASASDRLITIGEADLGYARDQAISEAKRCLSCRLCSECQECVKVCSANAIIHDQQPVEFELEVGGIILAQEHSMVKVLAKKIGAEVNEFGFVETGRFSPFATSKPGVFATGFSESTEDLSESAAQGSGAAACAMAQLKELRGAMMRRQEYPWERDVADEAPRIGAFICHCGRNISSTVDVHRAAAFAAKMPGVQHVETIIYACSEANQNTIKDAIKKFRLNRIVVASCSSQTHEALFQETLRESGLNQYLLSMTNIRDLCSWVHRDFPEAATDKAIELISMAVVRARNLKPLPLSELPVTPTALIIGGGLAGMTAALSVADQGFKAVLIEREPELGGRLRRIYNTLERDNAQGRLNGLVAKTLSNPNISVRLNSTLARIAGQAGNFTSIIKKDAVETAVNHGVVIVATGGAERKTRKHLYGKHPNVITQSKLELCLAGDKKCPALLSRENPAIVMIQCVESRDEKNPYCSRVCCSQAIKNALEIKRQMPNADVVIIGMDFRAPGFREKFLDEAKEKGIKWVQPKQEIVVSEQSGRLTVEIQESTEAHDIVLHPDLVVLSMGISPASGNAELSAALRTVLTTDGFYQEAHSKLRPVDLANEGEYICGVAHYPEFIDEAIAEALAAAGRAASILSKSQLTIAGQVAFVDPQGCVACAVCVRTCQYGAPMINDLKKSEIQGAKCMGCGACAAACPSRSITLRRHESDTVAAMLNELFAGDYA